MADQDVTEPGMVPAPSTAERVGAVAEVVRRRRCSENARVACRSSRAAEVGRYVGMVART
jgi:hypothetical protein